MVPSDWDSRTQPLVELSCAVIVGSLRHAGYDTLVPPRQFLSFFLGFRRTNLITD